MISYKEFIKSYLDGLSVEETRMLMYIVNCFMTKKDLFNQRCELLKKIHKAKDKLICWGDLLDADFQKEMLEILDYEEE